MKFYILSVPVFFATCSAAVVLWSIFEPRPKEHISPEPDKESPTPMEMPSINCLPHPDAGAS